ncbi:TRAP transporter small permease [Sulfitobacter dubius]|jgi:TRAP-type C4-dicarboxylate transport system permease small subunit|uniref:TRAP transporter small permease n=1 Tax=Sulfitobacter dubius TaxID=218673 RepID=UPI0022B03802|nr:TRAP transporter small permease [Sulfitobacter dubius]MCZ4366302.1 TRAP transporter small permease [Sulfitobacter dubius]
MTKVVQIANWVAKIPAVFAALLVGAMMVLVASDVVLKYVFNAPVPMTLELVAAYFMPAICFLPLGNVTRTESHLEVELFTQGMTGRPLAAIKLFGCAFGIVYGLYMLDPAIAQAMKMTARAEYWEAATVHVPVWPARWFLPLGVTLMILWLFLLAISHLWVLVTGQSPIAREMSKQAATKHSAGTNHD